MGEGTGGHPTPAATGGTSQAGPQDTGPRPDVYARLANDHGARLPPRRPPRGSRLVGWLLVVLTVTVVLVAVFSTHQW